MADTPSHEYRIVIAISLSGSDRAQSLIKAQIAPILDEMENSLRSLDLVIDVQDSTVKLGRGKKAEHTSSEIGHGD